MRTPGILLLLLIIVSATIAFPQMNQRVAVREVAAATSAREVEKAAWRYSKDAPFHDFLDVDAQQFVSRDPVDTAQRVCAEFGGEVGHMASVDDQQTKAPFLCRFAEHDVTMSVDFGELDRIPAP